MRAHKEWSVGVVWVIAAAAIFWLMRGDGHAYSSAVARARGFGYLGLVSLCLALCVTPLQRLLGSVWTSAVRWRRALGPAACAGALVHGGFVLASWPTAVSALWNYPALRAGMMALLILVLLALTSFPALVRRLGLRGWKELHRLAYLALAFAVWHAIMQPFAAELWILSLAGGCIVVGLLRWLPKR